MTSPNQQQQDAAARIANLFKGGAKSTSATNYVPVVKALESLGMPVRTQIIEIGFDVPTRCLVIPIEQLIGLEYERLSGVSIGVYDQQPDEGEPYEKMQPLFDRPESGGNNEGHSI